MAKKNKPPKWSFYRKGVPGFHGAAAKAEEMAATLARASKANGDDLDAGAVLAIDPRDDFGRQASAAFFARGRELSEQQALRMVDQHLADHTRRGTTPMMAAWTPLDVVGAFLSFPNLVVDDDYDEWQTEAPAAGFVRVVSIVNGRASFSVVAYETSGTA